MEPAICIEMLYEGLLPEEKIVKTGNHGFANIEFWGHGDKDIYKLASLRNPPWLVNYVNFSGQRRGDLIDVSTHHEVLTDITITLRVARELGTRTLMVLSNELGQEGQVVHSDPWISSTEKHKNTVVGLRRIMQIIPPEVTIVIEPLNTVLDHPGYFLDSIEEAIAIIEEVGDERVKILCDFYHLAMMGKNPVEIAQNYCQYIGHVHIADYPGRHEPGAGRGDWRKVLAILAEKQYRGYVGFEFTPLYDSDRALESVRSLWTDVFGKNSLLH